MKKAGSVLSLFLSAATSLAQFNVVLDDFSVSDVIGVEVYRPTIAVGGSNGSFAIAWGDERLGTSNRTGGIGDIYGVILQANGTPLTPNFQMEGLTFGFFSEFSLYQSSLLYLPSGVLIAAYHVDARTTIESIKYDDIYYSAFATNGQAVVLDRQINVVGGSGSGYGYQPHAVLLSPNFMVVFRYYLDGFYYIAGTLVDGSSGDPIGETFTISDSNVGDRIYPHAASNGTHTVVVWTDGRRDPEMGDIYLQRFVGTNPAGGNVLVNADAPGGLNLYGRVAMDTGGNFVVVWIDTRSHAGGDLYAQRFDLNGNRVGSELRLMNSNSFMAEYPPGLAMDSQGNFVVAWTDSLPGARQTVKTRVFTWNGTPLTDVLEITNSFAASASAQVDVRIGPNGYIFYTWLDGRSDSINGRIYAKVVSGVISRASEDGQVAQSFDLFQNYPNPFNAGTIIPFELDERSEVSLTIYNVLGQGVATVTKGTYEAGRYRITWNGYSEDRTPLPSGIYFYRLEAHPASRLNSEFSRTNAMILLK